MSALFEIRGLRKSYGDQVILDGLDFDIERGESLVILGRSGTGKSVTLRQLNGLEKPTAGTIIFEGDDITVLSERELYPVRHRVAMLFQSGALFDSMNVFENIAFPMRQHSDFEEEEIRQRVATKLEMVELPGIEETLPSELSGGMRKRVALARSLALDPEVILFDEPTTGLDPMTSDSIGHLILNARRQLGTTAVVVTHDLMLTRTVATRIAFLYDGKFRFVGTWDEAEASSDDLLHRFLNGRREED
ncbi:MAG: ABC transporter ATP-binding protein [Thermoanaerobaculia bacterium]|nr:ABC transporter ATP-binding protein [Thermoanaerobaculia bacterium]